MLAIALSLVSSVCWGLADFVGGLKSRTLPVLGVIVVSQAAGLVALAVIVAVAEPRVPPAWALGVAAAAGIAGQLALAAFYRALAIGTMSIVAPISATGAAVPVIVGLALGERPSALQAVGMVAALVGVLLASREGAEDPAAAASSRTSVLLAIAAAIGIGAFLTAMGQVADEGVLWVLLAARAAGVAASASVAAARRAPLRLARADLPALVLVGALDVSANGLFAWATTLGLLSIVAVLGALYPVATVLLARAVLGERIRRVQEAGVLAALTGVALIAAG